MSNFRCAAVALCAAASLMAACSTPSSGVATAYVSPLQFQSYDCKQITAEMLRIQVRVTQLGGRLDAAAQNDKALVGVGMILFWPALFALGGTKEQEAEYARLKGEFDALEKMANEKKCELPKAELAAAALPAASAASAAR